MGQCQRLHRSQAVPGQHLGAVQVGCWQQQYKFFAAVACGQLTSAAQASGQCVGHLLQAQVAGLVTIVVVVALEMIDVDHQQRQRLVLAGGAVALFGQAGVEVAAVADAG